MKNRRKKIENRIKLRVRSIKKKEKKKQIK